MSPFVRFVLLLLFAGIFLNLAIGIYANNRTQRQMAATLAEERTQFRLHMMLYNQRQQHADIVVEWQKVDASGKVMETSLLVRQYGLPEKLEAENISSAGEVALPVTRVSIPGNHLVIDGYILSFEANYPLADLEHKTLKFLAHIYGKGQPEDQHTALWEEYKAPLLVGEAKYFQATTWQTLWDLMKDDEKRQKDRGLLMVRREGEAELENGKMYSAYIGTDGVTIFQREDSETRAAILREAVKMDAEHAAAGL